MCKKTYFNHDCDARNDEKLIALRIRYGAEGYGVYFMLIEMLQAAPGCVLEKDYKALAFDLRVSARRIKSIVEDFGLFTPTDGGKKFYSERLIKYANEVDESYERYAEAGRKGMKARWNKSEPITMLSEKHNDVIDFDNDVIQTAPDAKTKEEKEREKEIFPPITPYKEKEKAKAETVCFMARARENEGDEPSDSQDDMPVNIESPETDAPGRADHNGMSTETLHASSKTLQAQPETLQAEAVEEVEAEEVAPSEVDKPANPRTPMKRPTLEEVQACIAERGYNVDAELFMNHYESNGWKVGKNPMKSWRAALVTWQKRNVNASTTPLFNPQTPNFNGTYQTRMDRERAENAERKRQLAEMAANACAKADALNAARFGNP
jgi:hypothetical protein